MELEDLGWSPARAAAFAPYGDEGWVPARIALAGQGVWRLMGMDGERLAEAAGRLRETATPVTGDWVAVAARKGGRAVIQAVLPRTSVLSRKVAGERTQEHVLAANLDVLFLVCGLDGDFNLRRLERALALAWESGALPVVLLNKADLCPEAEARAAETVSAAPGVDVHVVSARDGSGLQAVRSCLGRGRTGVLLGSSGVGKSTLLNRLLGMERQATRPVRVGDDRGRHTTTGRELFVLPEGGCLVDTPGLRELQLWTEGPGLQAAFADIVTLAAGCRYRDCRHHGEPGCAVKAAVAAGTLEADRLASLRKLEREQEALRARQDDRLATERKARSKSTQQSLKRLYRERAGRGRSR